MKDDGVYVHHICDAIKEKTGSLEEDNRYAGFMDYTFIL